MITKMAAPDQGDTRAIFGKALAALVAAQANWASIGEVHGAEREAIERWAAKAKVDLITPDAKARARLLDVANTELMSVALGSTHPKADDKLGELGLLSARFYEVELVDPIKSNLSEHGLTKKEIIGAVRYADAYQHLSPPAAFRSNAELVSLFVRVLNAAAVRDNRALPEWALVIGQRAGRKFYARDAYRIKASMLDDKKHHLVKIDGITPLSLFRAFCDAYGCELMLNGKPLGKFLVYERVQGSGEIGAHGPVGHKLHIASMHRSAGSVAELGFGYAIDLTTYGHALGRQV